MTAIIPTLNASVAQIEAQLRTGKTVQEVSDELAEPPNNVYGVLRAMRARGEDPASTGTTTATPRAPLRPVPAPSARPAPPVLVAEPAEPSVDVLIAAAARSESKRTQALAVKLADLATVVRDRLRAERETAERTAREKEERDRATAEVERLEKQLREAKAKLGNSRRAPAAPPSAASLANLNAGSRHGSFPCRHDDCDRILTTAAARGRHEKSHGGGEAA